MWLKAWNRKIMDNTIDKSIQMDSQMKEFFECISGDADTQQQRIQCIRNGLAAIADRLRPKGGRLLLIFRKTGLCRLEKEAARYYTREK